MGERSAAAMIIRMAFSLLLFVVTVVPAMLAAIGWAEMIGLGNSPIGKAMVSILGVTVAGLIALAFFLDSKDKA